MIVELTFVGLYIAIISEIFAVAGWLFVPLDLPSRPFPRGESRAIGVDILTAFLWFVHAIEMRSISSQVVSELNFVTL
jgi:uncharacterized protein YhhL (DUF1145 family)